MAATQPNIVVVLTDDQRRDSMRYMPNVQRLLVDQGTRYTQAMVPTSLCCPSRATILSGRYAHTSKVWGNGDVGGVKKGGWPRFYATGTESRTIATRLRDAGYQTALVGKYMNFFGKYAPPGYVPPGWETFYTLMSNHGAYYNYRTNDGVYHGTAPEDYSTDVFAAKAVDTIRSAPADRPLFLYFATYGPHAPFAPAPRHDGAMAGLLPDYTAPTLEQPLRSMPRWMRERVHVDKATADWTRLKQHEALLSVDEAVGRIHDALAETGRDRNTLFLFLSDNGYFWGEHRITGKDAPYKDVDLHPDGRAVGRPPAGRCHQQPDRAQRRHREDPRHGCRDDHAQRRAGHVRRHDPQGVRARGDEGLPRPAGLLRLADQAPDVRAMGHRGAGALRLPARPGRGAQPGVHEVLGGRPGPDAAPGGQALLARAAGVQLVTVAGCRRLDRISPRPVALGNLCGLLRR